MIPTCSTSDMKFGHMSWDLTWQHEDCLTKYCRHHTTRVDAQCIDMLINILLCRSFEIVLKSHVPFISRTMLTQTDTQHVVEHSKIGPR